MSKRSFTNAFDNPVFVSDNNQISSQIQTHTNDYKDFAQRVNTGIFDSPAPLQQNASKKTRYFKGDQGNSLSNIAGINEPFLTNFKAPPLSSVIQKNSKDF